MKMGIRRTVGIFFFFFLLYCCYDYWIEADPLDMGTWKILTTTSDSYKYDGDKRDGMNVA